MIRFGPFGGTGGRAVSLVSVGGSDGVGKTVRGGGATRLTGGTFGNGFNVDSGVLAGVAVGASVFAGCGGILRWLGGVAGGRDGLATGVGVTRNWIGGEGRVRLTGETDTAGVRVGAGTTDAAIDGLGIGLIAGDGRARTEGEAAGVAVAGIVAAGVGLIALAPGVGFGVDLGRAPGVTDGAALGVAAGTVAVATGVVAGPDLAGVVAAAGVADAVVVELSSGFTNLFGGAFGGGVDSVRILVRARSAAERSAIVQPLSTFSSITRSLMRRGRGISRTSVITGAEISSSSPRTVAAASVFCRRSRYRSIGRWLRERNSS
jgi:hypothetical protein